MTSSLRLARAVTLGRYKSTTTTARPPGFCFDIDGVLKRGSTVLQEGRQALKLLHERGLPFLLLTNGGGLTEETRSKALTRELGVPIQTNKLVQSHTPMRTLAQRYGRARVLAVGGKDNRVREVARSYGFQDVVIPDDLLVARPSIWPFRDLSDFKMDYVQRDVDLSVAFAAVMVFHDTRDYGRDIQIICDILSSRGGVLGTEQEAHKPQEQAVPIFFSNPDLLWANDYPVSRFGQGAFQTALAAVYTALTGRERLEATCCGKPHTITFDYAAALLRAMVTDTTADGADSASMPAVSDLPDFTDAAREPTASGPRRVYMVGDNPRADILGTRLYAKKGHPWTSLLVQTGVFKGSAEDNANAPDEMRADHVFGNVLQAVQWALQKEGLQ